MSRISLSMKDTPIEKILDEIEKNSEYYFLFNQKMIDVKRRVDVEVVDTPVKNVLDSIFYLSGIAFFQDGRQIILLPVNIIAKQDVLSKSGIVTGVITDEKGVPMAGVSVVSKGTTTGTLSDINGRYVINSSVAIRSLTFSFIGYSDREEVVNGRSEINVSMTLSVISMDEVVVTALGIKKEKKKLGYSVQNLDAPVLDKIPVANLATSLSGKIAGIKVTNSPNLFDQPNVILRGVTPVVVIDGVPVESATFWEISPDDIESMNVLKGPAAAVLYGQLGQNGVIQITTKKAKEGVELAFNSSTIFDAGLIVTPEYQKKYGTGYHGQYIAGDPTYEFWGAWGPEMDGRLLPQWNSPFDADGNRIAIPWIPRGKDNLKNLMNTGFVTNNNFSFGSKGENGDFRTSISQMYQKGVFDNTSVKSFTVNLSGGANLRKNLRFDAAINYSKLESPNYPSVGYGRYSPIYTGLLWTGANVDVRDLKNYWAPGLEGIQQRNFDIGPGYDFGSYDYNNPYFILHENLKGETKDHMYGSMSLKYDISPKFNITVRTAMNTQTLMQDSRAAYSTVGQRNGNYSQYYYTDFQSTSDLIAKYDLKLGDFEIDAMGGGTTRSWNDRSHSASTDGLAVPGIYTLDNTLKPTASSSSKSELLEYGVYGYVDVNWKSYIYLNATVRNQWSSTIPTFGQNSYLYPSVQAATVLSEYIPLPKWIDYLKARASLTKVGSAFSPYYFSQVYTKGTSWNDNVSLSTQSSIYTKDIKPSFSTGYELGTELRMFGNRLGFDFAYFYFIDGPQTYSQAISESSGWTSYILNGREDLRKGWELTTTASPIRVKDGLSWDIVFNLSSYRKYLHKLPEGQTSIGKIKVGDRWDAIYGTAYMRAPAGSGFDGQIIIGNSGLAQEDNITQKLGYSNSDFIIGISNTVTYKSWSLSASFDGCVGGKIISNYDKYMWAGGRSLKINDQERQNWYEGKDYIAPGVNVISGDLTRDGDGNVISDTRVFAANTKATNYFDYIQNSSGYYGINEAVLANRTYIKMREFALTYNVPARLLSGTPLHKANISLVGRNLFMYSKAGLIDPDQFSEFDTSDNLQTPSFRNIGFNINVTF
jgi:TonB-linked SusC/RagA family outer membrane protein